MGASIIKIEPEYFALPDTPARSKMTFYDGSTSTGAKIAEYYGSGGFDASAFNEPLIFTGTGDLVIQFTSGPNKQWLNWGGFKLRYSLLDSLSDSLIDQPMTNEASTGCGGEFDDNNGRIHYAWPSTQAGFQNDSSREGQLDELNLTDLKPNLRIPKKVFVHGLSTRHLVASFMTLQLILMMFP